MTLRYFDPGGDARAGGNIPLVVSIADATRLLGPDFRLESPVGAVRQAHTSPG